MRFNVEQTDTFGGEPNYGWVNRASFEAPDDASRTTLVRRAKAMVGLTGIRCAVADFGETIELRPRGVCQVVFISPEY